MPQILFITLTLAISFNGVVSSNLAQEDPAVTLFREYLRIPTDHPNPYPGYEQAVQFFKDYAVDMGLCATYVDLEDPNDFAFWLTWEGSDPSLKSVLLNSHMDVVAVDPEKWTYPPFDAYKDENGKIYARGTTDMKSTTIAQLEAIRRLQEKGFKPSRTVHLTIMPDEEKGGKKAMMPFVRTDAFKSLNVGIDIDEGNVNPGLNELEIINTEKTPWSFNVTARGEAAHGSTLPEFTAGQRLQAAIDQINEYRKEQFAKLQTPNITLGDLTVFNLVMLGGGLGDNIIPNELWAFYDLRIRILPGWNFTDVENMLENIAEMSRLGSETDPSNEVFITYTSKSVESGETIADDTNPWWTVLQGICRELDVKCPSAVSNGATDGRYVRSVGISAFGLTPFLNTPDVAHQDDEWISEDEFLKGIDRYELIISRLTEVPASVHS